VALGSGGGGGKVVKGVLHGPLYRAKTPSVHGESSRIHPLVESKIAPKFVMDSIGFLIRLFGVNSQRPWG
jgi:hypothetical protein